MSASIATIVTGWLEMSTTGALFCTPYSTVVPGEQNTGKTVTTSVTSIWFNDCGGKILSELSARTNFVTSILFKDCGGKTLPELSACTYFEHEGPSKMLMSMNFQIWLCTTKKNSFKIPPFFMSKKKNHQ